MVAPFSVIAHRGNSSLAPENTLPAFDLALESVPAFELDVQLTSDGVCVVLHDEVLGRTNNGTAGQLVADTSWAALSQLDAGAWFGERGEHAGCRIPTLGAVLGRYRHRCHIHLVSDGRLLYNEDGTVSLTIPVPGIQRSDDYTGLCKRIIGLMLLVSDEVLMLPIIGAEE